MPGPEGSMLQTLLARAIIVLLRHPAQVAVSEGVMK
jgi:hypothetical protein